MPCARPSREHFSEADQQALLPLQPSTEGIDALGTEAAGLGGVWIAAPPVPSAGERKAVSRRWGLALRPASISTQACMKAMENAGTSNSGSICPIIGMSDNDWRQKTAKGRWEAWSVILARDGGRWILIDTPGRTWRP